MNGVKWEEPLVPLIFNFAVEICYWEGPIKHVELKFNKTCYLVVYINCLEAPSGSQQDQRQIGFWSAEWQKTLPHFNLFVIFDDSAQYYSQLLW